MKAQQDFRRDRNTKISSLRRVGVCVVYTLSLRVELVGEHVVIEASARSGERSISVRRREIAAISSESKLWRMRAAACGPRLYDAGHSVGAVQGTVGATHQLEPIHLLHRHHTKVERATIFIDGDAVDDHLVVARLAAADE